MRQEVERLRDDFRMVHNEGVTTPYNQQIAHPIHTRARHAHLSVVRAAKE
jgi:hypothetical protein